MPLYGTVEKAVVLAAGWSNQQISGNSYTTHLFLVFWADFDMVYIGNPRLLIKPHLFIRR